MFPELARHILTSEWKEKGNHPIIALEGPVCAGKSSLLRKVEAKKAAIVIPEYSEYLGCVERPTSRFPAATRDEAMANFNQFLEIEKKRKELLDNSGPSIKYLDRSVFTLLAFELGVSCLTGIDIYRWALGHVADNPNVIVPDHVLYLDVSRIVAMSRAKAANMRTPLFMFSDNFNARARAFFTALNTTIPGYVSFINANENEEGVYNQFNQASGRWQVGPLRHGANLH